MTVKFNSVGTIKTRLGIQKNGPAHKYFAERCRQRMNERYVPMDKTELVNNSRVDNSCNIVYESPYAHYQYEGILYVDPKTEKGAFYNDDYGYWSRPGVKKKPTDRELNYHKVGTGPKWDKRMVSAEMKNVEKEVQSYVDRGCK